MWWMAAIAGATAAAGAASSFIGSASGAKELRRQAREEHRRLKLEHDQTIGETLARGAASGVETDSTSLRAYLNDMTSEFRREEETMLSAGLRSARNTERSAYLNLALGLGNSAAQYGASNNWWAKSSTAQAAPAYQAGQGMPLWK